MKRGRALVVVLVLFLVTVLVGSVIAIFSMLRGGGGSVEDGSTLVLQIGGSLPEQPMPDDGLAAFTGGHSTSVLEFDSALNEFAWLIGDDEANAHAIDKMKRKLAQAEAHVFDYARPGKSKESKKKGRAGSTIAKVKGDG